MLTPLFSVGTLPAGWSYETFWQFADSGSNPGDQDIFNGDMAGLQRYVILLLLFRTID